MPLMLIELSLETSETSVITCRLIRPSVSTTGVKLSEMPNFLKAIVARTVRRAAAVVWQVTPVGIGNSPPAMKVADFARDRGQIGLGQRAHHAGAFHRAQGGLDGRRRRRTSLVRALLPTSGCRWR